MGIGFLGATAYCPVNTQVLGGGCFDDGAGSLGLLNDHGPFIGANEAWQCSSNDSTTVVQRTLTAIALCAW